MAAQEQDGHVVSLMKNWIISAVKSGVTHIDDLLRLDKRTTRGFVRPLYIH